MNAPMVAIKNYEAERFLQRDVGSCSTFLLHGTDVGLASKRARRIVEGSATGRDRCGEPGAAEPVRA